MGDDFRALLVRYRRRRNWSQERLGLEAELDHSLISRIEGGARAPTYAAVAKVCAALGLSDDERDALYVAAGFAPEWLTVGALALLRRKAAAYDALATATISGAALLALAGGEDDTEQAA
jgi:transcriptional regulator with XRE-family HTH domain